MVVLICQCCFLFSSKIIIFTGLTGHWLYLKKFFILIWMIQQTRYIETFLVLWSVDNTVIITCWQTCCCIAIVQQHNECQCWQCIWRIGFSSFACKYMLWLWWRCWVYHCQKVFYIIHNTIEKVRDVAKNQLQANFISWKRTYHQLRFHKKTKTCNGKFCRYLGQKS